LTVIPTALVRFEVVTDQLVIERYFLNFWKIVRIFSVFRVIKVFTRRNMPMGRVIFKITYTLLLVVFIGAATMITFENKNSYDIIRAEQLAREDPNYEPDEDSYENVTIYKFHDMLYYMFVTMSTVGYGDISPKTQIG
jgi:hypothetical protein